MNDKGKAMVMASFLGDSLALGAHWIYDTDQIEETFGLIDALLKPGLDSYHPTKEKGDFTHLGDQTFVLLESLAAQNGFDLDDFSVSWQTLFRDYDGYFDKATKATLSGYATGKSALDAGSTSEELAGAARVAPLVFYEQNDVEKLVHDARFQTIMTHHSPICLECADFFARVGWMVLKGTPPVEAMKKASHERLDIPAISEWVQAGIESKEMDTIPAISKLGQDCSSRSAFPSVVHLISRYENDLKGALIQCVMAGGDSAARGLLVGMVLGAHLGTESLPEQWLSGLKKRERIEELLNRKQ
ncbi:MAG: ADP-ribosylglycohydrolase family protein [Deltaproteobacteria bacterium]|nr:ADP-ribosylglycohydrolase family protein [Deltaproteobacteria bacterium]MBW2052382.1 ADP-ribosylglycohydrolase family protein [Deltaproteobacteria bacterium]MBW2140994.1 ADP-ribosylglycohydrolase family protein [Deltaproteobacteria bacterium]MBW2324067.1 ADP-ribosylglycohydrolase family protein [Deltaproteobacteria bacterium]